MEDYYKILKISNDATINEIKKAYRKLALEYHPDRNHSFNAASLFIEITEAYEILSDKDKKEAYDNLFHKKDPINSAAFNDWQEQAYQKAYSHSKMDYYSYRNILRGELNVFTRHSSNLGCLAFLIFCVFVGILNFAKSLISGEKGEIKGWAIILFGYFIALVIFYPRITRKYQNDRKKIKK